MDAEDQREELWKQVLETAYKTPEELPGKLPGGSDSGADAQIKTDFVPPKSIDFLWQSFIHMSDTMPPEHPKLIHQLGSVVKVDFKASSKKCVAFPRPAYVYVDVRHGNCLQPT